jgi:hypothetical protein
VFATGRNAPSIVFFSPMISKLSRRAGRTRKVDHVHQKQKRFRLPHIVSTLQRLEVKTGEQLWSVPIEAEGVLPVSVLSPDGSRLFLGSGSTETLRLEIWDAVQGKKLRRLKQERP